MTTPRPPLRLVGSPHRDAQGDENNGAVILRQGAGSTPAEADVVPGVAPAAALGHAQNDGDAREPIVIEDDTGHAEEEPPRTPLSPRFAVVALIVFQLLAASSYLGKYAALTRGDDQFKFAAAMSVAASACLYIGAILLALRPGRGRALFFVAAAGYGLSLPAWGVGYGWSWPMAFGAILALAGAWYARAEVPPDPTSAAQP